MPTVLPKSESSDSELALRLRSLQSGNLLTIVGINATTLANHLPVDARRLLRLDLAGVSVAQTAIARILDDLASLALAAWPVWPQPLLSSWGRAAARLACAGRPPRFRQVAAEIQLSELLAAAGAPALIFTLDPGRRERADALIATLEWCRRHGAAVVATVAEAPPLGAPWDRVMQGAIAFEDVPEPLASRLILPLSPAPRFRGSTVERRMREALAADSELTGLLENEVTVSLGPLGPTPRVDLLWREGKIVVELDGPEHERDPNYGADRHRDYELLVAGYLVLRLTNAEVELDLFRSLERYAVSWN